METATGLGHSLSQPVLVFSLSHLCVCVFFRVLPKCEYMRRTLKRSQNQEEAEITEQKKKRYTHIVRRWMAERQSILIYL